MRTMLFLMAVSSIVLTDGVVDAAAGPAMPSQPGTLTGRVVDVSENALPGANVEIEPRGLELVTDREGRFVAANLPSGDYTIKVTYVGFKADEEEVKVAPGAHVTVEPKLQPQLAERVTGTASRAYQ